MKMIKGDFHVVEYLGWETTYTEIVPSDRLRPKSAEPPITATTFFKFNLAVPQELQEFCAGEKVNKTMIKLKGAFLYNFFHRPPIFTVNL